MKIRINCTNEEYELCINNKKYKNISCYKQQNLYIKNRFKN